MNTSIRKAPKKLALLCVVLVFGTTPLFAASGSDSIPVPLPTLNEKADLPPRVDLPLEEQTVHTPAPTEELALHFGYYGRRYSGFGYSTYRSNYGLSYGYRYSPYRSFGLSYYRPYYRGYSYYRPSYYYPGSYSSYSFRPSYYGASVYRPSYYGSAYYRPTYYNTVYSAPVYRNSFYGGYGYGAYGCGYGY